MNACTYVLYNTAVPTSQRYVLLQVKPHATVIPVLTYVGGTDSTCTLSGGIWLCYTCYTYISQCPKPLLLLPLADVLWSHLRGPPLHYVISKNVAARFEGEL